MEAEEERPEGAHEEQVAEIWRQAPNPYLSHDVAVGGSLLEWLALETCMAEKASKIEKAYLYVRCRKPSKRSAQSWSRAVLIRCATSLQGATGCAHEAADVTGGSHLDGMADHDGLGKRRYAKQSSLSPALGSAWVGALCRIGPPLIFNHIRINFEDSPPIIVCRAAGRVLSVWLVLLTAVRFPA